MSVEITYVEYYKEELGVKQLIGFSQFGGSPSGGVYLMKTGDDATGDYIFDTDTFVIDSNSHCIGIRTLSPEGHSLAINAADGNCLRLIYNDEDSGPTVYGDFSISADGDLVIALTGDTIDGGNNHFITTGGLGIGHSTVTDGIVNVGVGFRIANAAADGSVLRGNGTNFVATTPAALTKVDDTNVTLTLGGSPTNALITSTSLTLGWTGTLAVARGGTGIATTTPYSVICAGTTATGAYQSLAALGAAGTVLTSNGADALPSFQAASTGYWTASGNDIYNNNSGIVLVGSTSTDYIPLNGEGYNLQLNGSTYTSIGFHDSGNTVGNIKFSATNGFEFGASDGTYGPHNSVFYGNVGIGIAPVARLHVFGGNIRHEYSDTGGQQYGFINSIDSFHFSENAYFDGAWKAIEAAHSAAVLQTNIAGDEAFRIGVDLSVTDANEVLTIDPIFVLTTAGALTVDSTITCDGGNSGNWNAAYTHSQIAGGNSVHVSTDENTQWDAAYAHSTDSSQAHSDYLINNGNDTTSGALTATNFVLSSDERLKCNIKLYDMMWMDIPYKEFELKSEPGQKRFGVIAQDIIEQYPELVRTDENGMLSVAYIDLIIREIAYLKNELRRLQ